MGLMVGVMVWGQDNAKECARLRCDFAKERSSRTGFIPILRNTDCGAVIELEDADIDGVRSSMFPEGDERQVGQHP